MPSHTVSSHLGLVVLKPFFSTPVPGAAVPGLRRTPSAEDVQVESGKRSMDSLDSERSASVSGAAADKGETPSTPSAKGFWGRFLN